MRFAVKWFVPIFLVTMGLAWVSEQTCFLLGYEIPPQDLVKLFTNPNVPAKTKALFGVIAVIACPVVEETIFRGGVFRLLLRRWRKWRFLPAALAAAVFFALAHFAAGPSIGTLVATFPPLAFLGLSFAWAYEKTGELKAAMTLHVLFNAVNLAICLLFPEIGAA